MTVPSPDTSPGADLLTALTDTPGADIRDLSTADLSLVREALNGSLYLFALFIFGNRILDPRLHGQLAAYIELLGEPGFDRLMTQIPRDHLKSTLGTVTHALWRVSRQPDEPVAIFNEQADNPTKWMHAIRETIEGSLLYQAVYRDLLPPGIAIGDTRSTPRAWKWSDTALDLNGKRMGDPENTLSAWSVGSATAGHHWPLMIFDDLIGENHYKSPAEMEIVRSWIRKHTYLMRPAEQGRAYVNCTPWTFTDVYTTLTQEFGYKLLRRSALEDAEGRPSLNGQPIYPSRVGRDVLLKKWKRNPFIFSAQDMCLPLPGEQQSFSPEWVRNCRIATDSLGQRGVYIDDYDPEVGRDLNQPPPPQFVPLSEMRKAGFLDPAPSEAASRVRLRRSANALLVEAIDSWGRRFILETQALRKDPRDVIDTLFTLCTKWAFSDWYIEEVNFSKLYRHWINDLQRPGQDYGRADSPYLAAHGIPTEGKDKDTRIVSTLPGWRAGLYYVNAPLTLEFVDQLITYPNSQSRDLIDALGYDHHLRAGLTPWERERERRAELDSGSTRDTITGY